ncbi:hypothetical protein HJFPF1_05107 [Paramyrothecium foliicola]|nr:hypothetical protein HJFPF1_05107 [Paramyrothecium foliicola]
MNTPPTASFMGLPAELRLEIYSYLLTFRGHLQLVQDLTAAPLLPNMGVDTAILRTCRHISNEATAVLYKNRWNLYIFPRNIDITGVAAMAACHHERNRIRRLDLVIFGGLYRDPLAESLLLRGIRDACQKLTLLPRLTDVRIGFCGMKTDSVQFHRCLTTFGLLRGFHRVRFPGIHPRCAAYLAGKMTEEGDRCMLLYAELDFRLAVEERMACDIGELFLHGGANHTTVGQ